MNVDWRVEQAVAFAKEQAARGHANFPEAVWRMLEQEYQSRFGVATP